MALPLPVRVAAAALIACAATACGRISDSAGPQAPPAQQTVYEFRGQVVAIDMPRGIVEIDHEAIPGFMPAMTMPYEVADPGLLQGLSTGDRVHGTLRVDSRGYIITALVRG